MCRVVCIGEISHCLEHGITWKIRRRQRRSQVTHRTFHFWQSLDFTIGFGFLPKTGEKKEMEGSWVPSINVGPAMCGVVLTEKATTWERTSIWPMSAEDLNNPAVQKAMEEFTVELNKKLKMHDAGLKAGKKADQLLEELEDTPYSVKYEPFTMAELGDDYLDVDPKPITLPPADELTEKEQLDLDQNRFISARVKVPVGGEEKFWKGSWQEKGC